MHTFEYVALRNVVHVHVRYFYEYTPVFASLVVTLITYGKHVLVSLWHILVLAVHVQKYNYIILTSHN